MLNKTIDYALVGHNYITFLLSLGLLKRGKKVLVLDDNRFNYGDFFTHSLTSLDVDFLKRWGEDQEILPLINIDHYLAPEKISFFIGKKQIVLGDSPLRNLRELARKFPYLFQEALENFDPFIKNKDAQDFNNEFDHFSKKIAALSYREKNTNQIHALFEKNLPKGLQHLFDCFFKNFREMNSNALLVHEQKELKAFTFLLRGFFQTRLSVTGTRAELLHLFMSLVSPYYKLDHEKFILDLQNIHQESGGEFKKLNLADLKFQKGLVKSFALESVDGVIKPQKIAFIGGYPLGLPIKISTSSSSYNCLNVKIAFSNSLAPLIQNKKVLFTSPLKIGTDRPFWEGNFFTNSAEFNLVVLNKEGGKVDFVKDHILQVLMSDLLFLYPEFNFDYKDVSLSYTLDVFIEDKDFKAHKRSDSFIQKKLADVVDATAPQLFSRLKNALYFGPYNEDSMGTFSSLVEIKRWKEMI